MSPVYMTLYDYVSLKTTSTPDDSSSCSRQLVEQGHRQVELVVGHFMQVTAFKWLIYLFSERGGETASGGPCSVLEPTGTVAQRVLLKIANVYVRKYANAPSRYIRSFMGQKREAFRNGRGSPHAHEEGKSRVISKERRARRAGPFLSNRVLQNVGGLAGRRSDCCVCGFHFPQGCALFWPLAVNTEHAPFLHCFRSVSAKID
jgi:hypothetical protein